MQQKISLLCYTLQWFPFYYEQKSKYTNRLEDPAGSTPLLASYLHLSSLISFSSHLCLIHSSYVDLIVVAEIFQAHCDCRPIPCLELLLLDIHMAHSLSSSTCYSNVGFPLSLTLTCSIAFPISFIFLYFPVSIASITF